VIPDGVSVRNFVYGRFLSYLRRDGEVLVVHAMPPGMLASVPVGPLVESEPLQAYRESPASFTLRYAISYAHMFWADTHAMRATLARPIGGSWRTRLARRAGRVAGRLAATQQGIRTLSRLHHAAVRRAPMVRHYLRLLAQHGPSILFCAHQRPPQILPIVLAARLLRIPTATFIFSWDNLSSKGSIAAPFDHFLVWSNQMREELLRYYPDAASDRVHVVGSPQFDPYADDDLVSSREAFFRQIGANPRQPLICYTGGDRGTCPEDPLHLRLLLDLVRSGQIRRRPQVLVRPSPADPGDRYDTVRAEFPELLYAPPIWTHPAQGGWAAAMPSLDDVCFLANLARHADVNVNMASTMTLDFAINDKPVVNIAFDAINPPRLGVPIWEHYYQFEHYRPVVQLGAARFARSPAELCQHINGYLADPAQDRESRRRLVQLEIGVPPGRSAAAVAETLRSISA
jgi:hypothetical protein